MGKRQRLRPGKPLKRSNHSLFASIKKVLSRLDPFTYADMLLERAGLKGNEFASWPIYLLTALISAWLIYTTLGFILGTRSPAVIVLSGSMEPTFYRGDIMVLTGVTAKTLNAQEVTLPFSIGNKNLYSYARTYCEVKGLSKLIECRALFPYIERRQLPFSSFNTKRICFPDVNKCIELNKKGDIVVYLSDTRHIPIIHRVVVKIRARDGTFVLTKGDSIYNSLVDQEAGLSSSAVPVKKLEGKVLFMIPKLGYVKLIIMDDIPCIIAHPTNFSQKCILP